MRFSHHGGVAVLGALAAITGCDQGQPPSPWPDGQHPRLDVTVTSLSPGSEAHPTLLSMLWVYDDEGTGDKEEAVSTITIAGPASYALSIGEPTHFWADLDQLRALPSCSDATKLNGTPCWDDAREARPQGRGKLAVGSLLAYEDLDGDGKPTAKTPRDTVRGRAPTYLLYAKDLDAAAIQWLGQIMLLNPQAIKPGFNVAKVRCKDKVGWTRSFDPFELVQDLPPLQVESVEAFNDRMKSGEICDNWT